MMMMMMMFNHKIINNCRNKGFFDNNIASVKVLFFQIYSKVNDVNDIPLVHTQPMQIKINEIG